MSFTQGAEVFQTAKLGQLKDYLTNTIIVHRNVTVDGVANAVEQQTTRLCFAVIDRMLAEFDRRFTGNRDLRQSLTAFDACS